MNATPGPDVSAYLDGIQRWFPKMKIASWQFNQDGLVNDVLIINEVWVFRFPKNELARQLLGHEARILEVVRRYISLPVPYFENQSEEFAMYRLIEGRALHQSTILRQSESIQEHLAEQLATFLRELHAISIDVLLQNRVGRADSVRPPEAWVKLYQEAEQKLFPLLQTHGREWVQQLFAPVLSGRLELNITPVLIHGDLGPYHILVNDSGQHINGVIDFGTGGLGDAADDFANIINGLGERFLRRMAAFYPGIWAHIDRARFYAGALEIQWALGGLRTNDKSWFMVHLGRARDVWPGGAS